MPKLIALPNPDYAPQGALFEAETQQSVWDAFLDHGIEIDHACGKGGACTACHVIVRQGFETLNPPNENEEDMLDLAWGLELQSMLSRQAIIDDEYLVLEIPKYSVNLVKESS